MEEEKGKTEEKEEKKDEEKMETDEKDEEEKKGKYRSHDMIHSLAKRDLTLFHTILTFNDPEEGDF